ncbi:MAG TPA: radical SAM family heme chaperone HemW [Bacteroidia bacterium]|nr:radical SAM family heme chaperone HemW [Bacteroidia bacterium]
MAGIYLHIPFCRQACHYCDFHFSTSHKNKDEFVLSLLKEIELRRDYLQGEKIDTIYFGGGTPSLLSADEIARIIDRLQQFHDLSGVKEVTLEANPDDLTATYLRKLRHTAVNRLSIGIQSFRDEDLKLMNRAHDSKQAQRCVPEAADIGFENITIDLIYGIPGLSQSDWQRNLETALQLPINHLSSYCLTVEPKTALTFQVNKGKVPAVNDDEAADQFDYLISFTEAAGMPWYEVSNFAKPGFESKHNSSYWTGARYLGLGPAAHSFNGKNRSWNVKSNAGYIQQINENILPSEEETLTAEERFNEVVLTSLRTRKGLTLSDIRKYGNENTLKSILEIARKKSDRELLELGDEKIVLTRKGLLFADAIASEFFITT